MPLSGFINLNTYCTQNSLPVTTVKKIIKLKQIDYYKVDKNTTFVNKEALIIAIDEYFQSILEKTTTKRMQGKIRAQKYKEYLKTASTSNK